MAASPLDQHGSKPVSKPPSTPISDAQWIFTETELASTPSIADGMPVLTERELRTKGLNFILQVGIMLKIQQLTLYTAGVFFNRFLMRHSMQKSPSNPKPLHHYQIAATALLLATKTDETLRRTKDIIIACCRVAQKNPNLLIDEQNKDYWKWRDTLLFNEDVLLESLCFDLTVESPYKLLYDMLRRLGVETNKVLRNAAWAFLCDSLMTTLCLMQSSRTIAAAALWCGAKFAGTMLPGDEPDATNGDDQKTLEGQENGSKKEVPWWEVMDVRLHDVKKACNYMAELYEYSAAGKLKSVEGDGSSQPTSQSQSQSQSDKNIYAGLRSDLSDEDEEDGELVDDATKDVPSRLKRKPNDELDAGSAVSQELEERASKRQRSHEDDESGAAKTRTVGD